MRSLTQLRVGDAMIVEKKDYFVRVDGLVVIGA
jgi:hypothetical protein